MQSPDLQDIAFLPMDEFVTTILGGDIEPGLKASFDAVKDDVLTPFSDLENLLPVLHQLQLGLQLFDLGTTDDHWGKIRAGDVRPSYPDELQKVHDVHTDFVKRVNVNADLRQHLNLIGIVRKVGILAILDSAEKLEKIEKNYAVFQIQKFLVTRKELYDESRNALANRDDKDTISYVAERYKTASQPPPPLPLQP